MIYTQMRSHARRLAKDPNASVPDADVLELAQDVYTTYWESFLKDRVFLQSGFVVFSAGEYVAEAAVAVRDVQELVRVVGMPQSSVSNPMRPAQRDDFDAVVADSEANPDHANVIAQPLRWGIRAQTDDNKPIIAIYPPSTGVTMAAMVHPLRNTLSTSSPAGDLQGDDLDGYAVARLLACEIMWVNGEDPVDIDGVFRMLDQKIQDKFRGIADRAKPRAVEGKTQ